MVFANIPMIVSMILEFILYHISSDDMSDDDNFEEELSRQKFLREQASFLCQEEIYYQKHQEYLE